MTQTIAGEVIGPGSSEGVLLADAASRTHGLRVLAVLSALMGVVANSIGGALAGCPDRAGAVSALVGAIHYGSGIVGSGLVGAFADGTAWPMGWVIALAGLGSLASARLLIPRRPGPQPR